MDVITIGVFAIAVVAIAALGWFVWQQRQSKVLAERYGPEYQHVVNEAGSRRRAEAELRNREERVEQFEIRPLTAQQQSDYLRQWRATQARFVDDPSGAIREADVLVEDAMMTRGYPVSDFDQRAADLSVHHPRVVNNYRAARDVAQRHRRGDATTEELRQAMVYYRELFEDLLEDREHSHADVERQVERHIDRPPERAADLAARDRGLEHSKRRVIHDDREVRP